MKRANIRFNYQDYLRLPEDKRYEILDGELCMVPAPTILHQRVAIRLQLALFKKADCLSSPLLPRLDLPTTEIFVVESQSAVN
jgi:hypothetical protein